MIILDKKKIVKILSVVMIFIFAYIITGYNVNNTKNQSKTIETVALPVNNKVIVIDAGHGVPDEGAQSSNGTTEAESNLKIALKVQNLLEQSGATVILTRSDENAIYDLDSKTLKQKKISDIHNRVKIGNESSADIFVSIHLNKIPQQQYWGWQTFYKQESPEGQKLATARAYYKNAPLVVLDEPTASLDPISESNMYKCFNSIIGNKTAIYISHRLASVKFCDNVLVMADGKVIGYGTHDELMSNNEIYREMYLKQSEYYNDTEIDIG